MQIENGKISSRQTLRLFVFDLMGIATLLLPPYLARLSGMDGVWAILAGTTLGFIYLIYLGWIMKHMAMDANTYLETKVKLWVRSIVLIFVLIHCVFTAGFCAYVFAKLMQYSLVPQTSFGVILAVILFLAAYAVSGGIESRARVYEVLFWIVLIPYIAMMLASVKNVELDYIRGMFVTSRVDFAKSIYLVFLFFTPLFFSLFLIGEKKKNHRRNVIKTISISILIAGGILLGSYVLLLGNFGGESLASMQYPVVTLMSTIQFKGNFLKRMDAFMVAVWFFTLYALLNLHLHYGVGMFRMIFSKGKSRKWQVFVAAVFVFFIGYAMGQKEDLIWLFVNFYSYIAVPVMLLGPGILLIAKRK